MKKLQSNWQAGLTLVEALVAITILIVGVLGPLSIAARGIGDGIFAENQLAANYLAQEALEVIINKRYGLARQAQYVPPVAPATIFDDNSNFTACVGVTTAGHFCVVDAKANPATFNGSCTAGDTTNCRLVYNVTDGLYEGTGAAGAKSGTVFTRKVKMQKIGTGDELKVTVIIEWYNKDVFKTLTIVEHLFSKG